MAHCHYRLMVGLIAVMSLMACNESKKSPYSGFAQEGEECGLFILCDNGLVCGVGGKCVVGSSVTPQPAGLNEYCDSLHICGSGLFCSNKKCTAQTHYETVTEGQHCDGTHICSIGLNCNENHICEKNKPDKTIVGEGEHCDLTHLCADRLVCNSISICTPPQAIVPVGINENCDSIHVCTKGLFCNASSVCEKHLPITTVGENDACDSAHICDSPLSCIGGVCKSVSVVDVGGVCDGVSKFCKTGLYCNASNKCTKPISQVVVGLGDDCDGASRICDTTQNLACIGRLCVEPNEEIKIDCKNGQQVDKTCICAPGYIVDGDGICTQCADGYEPKNGKCEFVVSKPEQCDTVFYYTNQWTHKQSGGISNFDVYLVGSFNEWKAPDPKYKMTYLGNGTHGIKVQFEQGSGVSYKFYVDGWAEDSWKSDPANGSFDEYNNNFASISACGLSFGNANGMSIDNPYVDGEEPVVVDPDPIVVDPDPSCITTFKFTNQYTSQASGGEQDWDVYLIGDMNEWKVADPNYKMVSDGNGTHTISLALPTGTTFKYKFYVNGWGENSYHADPAKSVDIDGNNLANITSCGQVYAYNEDTGSSSSGEDPIPVVEPGNISLVSTSVSNKTITIKVKLSGSAVITSVDGGSGSASFNGDTITDTVTDNNKYVYTVKTESSELYVPVWVEDTPFDWHDALLYFAFTDRFKDGNPSNNSPATEASHEGTSDARWMGGDFKGLQEKVEEGYFDALGVNTLWISSVSMNTQGVSWGSDIDPHYYSAYHSYWPIATFMTDKNKSEFGEIKDIEPHFGTHADLKNLVDACHKRGMRVLVDFAANHVHRDSPMFSKHPEWFNDASTPRLCDDNGNWDNYSEKCWFSGDLPDINYENANARQAMVDHAVWLIKHTNIDGFRVDAVKHMNIQLVRELRAAIDQLFANTGITFYMVGETFTGDVDLLNRYIGNDRLHAQFDFPLYFKIQGVLKGYGFYDVARNYSVTFNSDLMGTFMGNHDVARALSVAGYQNEGKWGQNPDIIDEWMPYFNVKAAWTILMTRPGVPLIYYGDEAGMVGAGDPDNRRMMIFGDQLNEQQKSMLDYVQRLGRVRKAHPALRHGKRTDLHVDNENWCYLMTSGNDNILVAISTISGYGCDLHGEYRLKNLLSDEGEEFTASSIDMSVNHLNIYQVK